MFALVMEGEGITQLSELAHQQSLIPEQEAHTELPGPTKALMGNISWNWNPLYSSPNIQYFAYTFGDICFTSKMNIISQSATISNIHHIQNEHNYCVNLSLGNFTFSLEMLFN